MTAREHTVASDFSAVGALGSVHLWGFSSGFVAFPLDWSYGGQRAPSDGIGGRFGMARRLTRGGVTPPAPPILQTADRAGRRTLTATAVAAVLIGSAATAVPSVSASPRPVLPPHPATGSAARSSRPDRADWEKIKSAARLRDLGVARHRTAYFRSVAGLLGLSQLATIQPLAPGRCQVALTYLYGNLRDLADAHPG